MAPAAKRRSTRQAAGRKRSIYYEPDTDEDDFEVSGKSAEDLEADGGREEEEAEEAEEAEEEKEPAPKKRKVSSRRTRRTRGKAAAQTNQTALTRAVAAVKARKAKPVLVQDKGFDGPTDGRTPAWTELPVEILKQIFTFAALPVDEFSRDASANATWLLRSARSVCRAFALPALEALYQSPPLLSTYDPHQLLDVLRMPSGRRYMDYNVKIQRLNVDVRTVAYAASGRPSLDLAELVSQLPRLQHMELLHPRYKPPFRPVTVQKWSFSPAALIRAFEERGTRLRTWRWSRDTIPRHEPRELYQTISTAHDSIVFAYLKRLVVTGFNADDSLEPTEADADASGESRPPPPGLATSIAKLPSLVDLTFISCDAIMDKFLQRLPTNLRRLELTNCLEITSEMMRDYFKTSGSQLTELALNHNAALNLSFTTSLKELTPRLEVLKVDLRYYSEKDSINDAEALYDELLPEGEVSSWPATLRHLEIVHAQKWSPEAAQNLFRSLVDSAPELPHLRDLIIHAHINIPWRDRAGFRDQWIERLARVYLRRNRPPSEHLGSIRKFQLWQQAHNTPEPESGSTDELSRAWEEQVPYCSGRATELSPRTAAGDTECPPACGSDENAPTTRQPRRSRRVAEHQASMVDKTATPSPECESEFDSDSGVEEWRRTPEKFIHGLCATVDIRIDNQRPRENQWTEEDFMDDEVSGDEDWNGDAEDDDDGYAW